MTTIYSRARNSVTGGLRAWKVLSSAALLLACFTTAPTFAGDIEAGKASAAICASCHGAAGISSMDMWPNLAGQKTTYLAKQMKAFRDGVRKDSVMNNVVIGLSDSDIDNISAYYNSLPGGG